MTKQTMLRNYRKIDSANSYILGFVDKGVVYMVSCPSIPPRYISYEQASRNQGMSLRLRLRKSFQKQLMKKAIAIGIVANLSEGVYNKGENFERLVTERFGMVWKKDNIACNVQGDICVNGEEIQIKFDGATLTNEKTLKNLRKRG